jgi:hypothetical protein
LDIEDLSGEATRNQNTDKYVKKLFTHVFGNGQKRALFCAFVYGCDTKCNGRILGFCITDLL